MNKEFKDLVENLDEKFQSLINMFPVIAYQIPSNTPKGGVYLFSENGKNLYAGRTKREISVRIRNHFNKADDCPFAWLLARKESGKKATYKIAGSRKELLLDPIFRAIYDRARDRIRNMQVRYVQESEPIRQALLEIYVSVAAKTEFNDFDTH